MKPCILMLVFIFLSTSCSSQSLLDQKLKKPLEGLLKVNPQEVGMSSDSIENLLTTFRQSSIVDFRSVVVIKDHQLVLEEYFNSYWRATIHDIRSAGKSVTAILMGIAIDQGLIKDVEQSVFDFFPEYQSGRELSKEHQNIKIKHLLMMSSGLDADAYDINSTGHAIHWLAEDNWLERALALPMKFDAGTKWVYNDVCAMLSSAIIQKVSGQSLGEFAEAHLFGPLGIREYYWYKNVNGITGGMGNLYLTNLDFAKIGLLLVNQGRWKDRQIVSASWIQQMLTKHLDISAVDPFADFYGYFWYIAQTTINGKDCQYYFASGNGGNKLYIVPLQNLVISIQSSAYGKGYGHGRANYIFESVLSAIGKQ